MGIGCLVSGKVSGEALTEEEQLNDLLLLIKLLASVLSKDFLDFSTGRLTQIVGSLWYNVPSSLLS